MLKQNEERSYLTILADGKMHMTVQEGTPGSVVRTYETSDGKTGSKTEMVYTQVIGKITNVAFREGTYGTQLQLTIEDKEEKPVVLSVSTSSNYGEDLMKKLMAVDTSKLVKIVPFSFTDDKGKNKKGVTIWQHVDSSGKAQKIGNYFYDTDKKANIHGYPEPKKLKSGKPLSKDQWKMYFAECREFLVEKITEKFGITETVSAADDEFDKMVEDAQAAIA